MTPLAHIPGIFAVLWTDKAAGETAFALGTVGVDSALNVSKTERPDVSLQLRTGPRYAGHTVGLLREPVLHR